MSVLAALASGQRAAEALMTDSGIMRRPSGRAAQDPVTGSQGPGFTDLFTLTADPVYGGGAKIQTRNLVTRDVEAGGRTTVTVRVELHIPISAPAVMVGDVWEHTAVGEGSDPQLVGRKFRVTAPVGKSKATARRFEVEEIVK